MSRRVRFSNDTRDVIILVWAGYIAYFIWSSVALVWK